MLNPGQPRPKRVATGFSTPDAWRRVCLGAAICIAACAWDESSLASSPPTPSFSVVTDASVNDLGTLPGGTFSFALDVNALGQVVGYASTVGSTIASAHGFLWTSSGEMIDLGTLASGDHSIAVAINNLGQIVGYSRTTTASRPIHAFLWSPETGMRDLGTLAGDESVAAGINDAGQVSGWTSTPSGEVHAFVWTAASGMRDLGTLGGNFSRLNWINELGQAAGASRTIPNTFDPFRAMVWSSATRLVPLGALNDGLYSEATRMNNLGEAVGASSINPSGSLPLHPFLWTSARGMVDIGTLGGDGYAYAINDLEQVVGYSTLIPGGSIAEARPFLWTAEGGMVQLPTLGGLSGLATDINDRGIAVGRSYTASGEDHAALWTITLTPPTPVEQIDFVVDEVRNAVSVGALPAGPAEGLLAKLDAATRQIERGNSDGAVNLLEAFIHQVEALVQGGSVSAADAQRLIEAARRAIAQLSGGV